MLETEINLSNIFYGQLSRFVWPSDNELSFDWKVTAFCIFCLWSEKSTVIYIKISNYTNSLPFSYFIFFCPDEVLVNKVIKSQLSLLYKARSGYVFELYICLQVRLIP